MADVFKNFVEQKPNPRHGGTVYWKSTGRSIMFCEGDTAYSYGYHFPLAKRVGEEKDVKGQLQPVFVKNGDRYSPTTSGHQAEAQAACQGPTVSRVNLEAAGIDFKSLTLKGQKKAKPVATGGVFVHTREPEDEPAFILYWRADSREYITWNKKTKKYYKDDYTVKQPKQFTPPKQGMFVPYRTGDGDKVTGVWHILGAVVIQHQEDYFLCALDGNSYFVSQLPRKPRNIDDAFECLKPAEVRKAEKEGKKVLRQGEWFFIELNADDTCMATNFKYPSKAKFLADVAVGVLPRQSDASNRHEVSRLFRWPYPTETLIVGTDLKVKSCIGDKAEASVKKETKVRYFAKSKVFHRSAWSNALTRDHATVTLGDQQWYAVYHNTEVRSWSQGGRFD